MKEINYFDRLSERPIRTFMVWTASAVIMCLTAYWLASVVANSSLYPIASSDLAAPLALAFGTSVSLAGALVAIVLASYAVRLQKNQDIRESIETRLNLVREADEGIRPYSKLFTEIRRFNTSAQLIYSTAGLHDLSILQKAWQGGTLSDEEGAALQAIRDDLIPLLDRALVSIENVAFSLDNIAIANRSSSLCSEMWGQLYDGAAWQIDSGSGRNMSVRLSRPSEVSELLLLFARQVKSNPTGSLGNSMLEAFFRARVLSVNAVDRNGDEFDHARVRSMLLAGLFVKQLGGQTPVINLFLGLAKPWLDHKHIDVIRNFFLEGDKYEDFDDAIRRLPMPISDSLAEDLDTYSKFEPKVSVPGN